MARLFSSGFELNSEADLVEFQDAFDDGSLLTIVTTPVRSGTYSMEVKADGVTGRSFFEHKILSSPADVNWYLRVYIRKAADPSGRMRVLCVTTMGTGERANLRLNTDGTIQLFNAAGTQIGSNSAALNNNQWYMVEMHYNSTNGAGADVLEARLDGSVFATSSAQTLSTADSVIVGSTLSASNGTYYLDDLGVNDSSGSFQTSWPGEGSIVHLRPNATGDNSDWTGTNADIDEVTPDDATTVIESTTLNHIEDVNLDAAPSSISASDVISLVQVGHRFRADGAAEPGFVVRIKASASGTVEESSEITPTTTTWLTNALVAPFLYPLTLYDLPGASTTAWTKAALDTTQIGARISTDSTNNIEISTMWLLVEYVPTINTRNKRASAIGFDSPSTHIFPNPDGTLDQADRQQSAYKYSGIAAGAPVGGGTAIRDFIQVGFIPFAR